MLADGANDAADGGRVGRGTSRVLARGLSRVRRQAAADGHAPPKRCGGGPEMCRRSIALVDAYNALSLRYAVPIGGEDLDAYAGSPRLTVAAGRRAVRDRQRGAAIIEPVDPGEVIWRDDAGVTCRRWNWRQSPRTRLEPHSTAMWFVIERLEPMPLDALGAVGDALAAAVRDLAPEAKIATQLLRRPTGG